MTIWIVTTGSYSDYHVHSVWSTEEKAKRMVDILERGYGSDASYFSVEVDEPCSEKPGFEVLIDLTTGEEVNTVENNSYEYPMEIYMETPSVDFWDYVYEEEIKKDDNDNYVTFNKYRERNEPVLVRATNSTVERALKSARDFRAQFLAKQAGI